ncbi:Hypothetical predicted protein [Prunus dulcis]|uniref:Uncharacterized protein n=1 Tax=Prunus dulcis TaxID=3755 RepID=A0A5E4FZR0_PRUDU|nr:hypothetical protein L3X38_042549 [Prunus dulcis]VVA32902.1 Hypothetical predicted protein [Prunus dulcis]
MHSSGRVARRLGFGVLSSIDSALALPFGKADWRASFVSSRLRWVSRFKFSRVLPFGRIKCRQRVYWNPSESMVPFMVGRRTSKLKGPGACHWAERHETSSYFPVDRPYRQRFDEAS